jgi:hypothetical protein|tara:strand:- start:13 stop:237 length:225 start_codon:yes stop_codon:yes gene_type:complete
MMEILLETREEKEMKKDWEEVIHKLDLVDGEFVENIQEETIEDLEFGDDFNEFDIEMYSLINDLSGNFESMMEY